MRKAKPYNPIQYAGPNAKVPFLAPDVVTKVIPSPVEGLDAISPLAEMDPKRAPILTNWVPRPGFVEIRGGYIPFSSTVINHAVESLMVYRAQPTQKMFAAASSGIWDVSTANSVKVVSNTSNARWQYVNFTPSGASTVIQLVNGADPLLQWDGTSWTNPSITGLPVGVTTANFVNIWADKQRLFYVVANSQTVIIMPTQAIQGAIATTQNFGALWTKGGFLMAVGTWTIDGGNGPQAYTVFLSSQGQASVYAGTDPTNPSAWSLVGTFNLPPPIGRRCMMPIGSDLAIITQQGVVPISQALPFDPSADRSIAITTRIQNAVAQAAATAQNNFGWELATYPNQQLLFLNVPFAENVQQNQYVMNTLTGAWGYFSGWNANTFAFFNNNLYFGDNSGYVHQAYTGSADFTSAIQADMQCAFNWLDEPGRVKRMTMIQPLLNISQGITPTLAIDTDFMSSTATAPISNIGGSVVWDKAIWDQSQWPTASVNYLSWLTVDAIGHALAVRMRAAVGISTNTLALFDISMFDVAAFDAALSPTVPVLQVNAFNSISELGGAI